MKRQTRIFRPAVIALAGLGLIGTSVGGGQPASSKRIIEAKSFWLFNDLGTEIIFCLEASAGGSSLLLGDYEGNPRAHLKVTDEESTLSMSDQGGSLDIYQNNRTSYISFGDAESRTRIFISVDGTGEPSIKVYSKDKKVTWSSRTISTR